MDPRQDLLSRHRGPLPEGTIAVRFHRVPTVEKDALVAFHARAHGQQGRQMEHEVGAAVDQRDLARLERPEDPVEGGHERREGRTRLDADLRDDDGFRGERDGTSPRFDGDGDIKSGAEGRSVKVPYPLRSRRIASRWKSRSRSVYRRHHVTVSGMKIRPMCLGRTSASRVTRVPAPSASNRYV